MYFEYGENEITYLRNKDKKLSEVIDQIGMIEREVDTDLFSAVVHHIIGQPLDLMSRGADGVISVAVNAFPRKMMTCIDLAKKGDFEGAHKAYECLEEAVTALFAEGNPTGVKCAMSVLGLIGNTLRLPLVPGTPQLEARFKELIAKYDLN